MKLNLITYAFFSIVLMLFSSFAQASTFNYAAQLDTVLSIKKTKNAKTIRNGRKFKKGQTITFRKNYSTTEEKGKIIGFKGDAIIVKDRKRKIQTIELEHLTAISRGYNLRWVLPAIGGILFIVFFKQIVTGLFLLIMNGALIFLLGVAVVFLFLGLIFLIIRSIFKKHKEYHLGEDWKAEIGTVE